MLSLQLAMKVCREIYAVLMDYFAEELGAAQEKGGGQSSTIVGDSGYASAIPSITCSLHGDVRPKAN